MSFLIILICLLITSCYQLFQILKYYPFFIILVKNSNSLIKYKSIDSLKEGTYNLLNNFYKNNLAQKIIISRPQQMSNSKTGDELKYQVQKNSPIYNAIQINEYLKGDNDTNSKIKQLSSRNVEIKDQIQIKQQKSQSKRVHEPIPLFIIHLIIAGVISFQNIFIIYGIGPNYDFGLKIIIADLFVIIIFSFVNSLFLVPVKNLILMYTLFDSIFVSQIAALIGLIGSLLITTNGETHQTLIMIMIPISFFCFVGNFRVCIRYADWNRLQIIVYKISILAGAVCFFQIGAYFMAVNFSYTGGVSADTDSKIKDFITLYAFGTFQFFLQLFGKICDFDQTSQLKYIYQFKQVDEND